MTPELSKLICGIVDDYFAARDPVRANVKLVRGVARITSSLAEERIAEYVLEKNPNISKIYIDQGINIAGERLHKPDLVICVGNEVRVLVDVKMDLGHIRTDFHELAKNANKFIQCARNAGTCSANIRPYKEGSKKEKIQLSISKEIHHVFFIVSGGNISPTQFTSQINQTKNLNNISTFTLFPGDHANDQFKSRDETVAKLVNSVDFKALQEFDDLLKVLCKT